MSAIDTRLPPAERSKYLAEVRTHLPAFLSSDATEQVDPVGDVTELLNLTKNDLARVSAVHVALSDPVRSFVSDLPSGLRRPITSSSRPRVVSQAIRGPIDWGATIRDRAARGSVAHFVTRPAERLFDTPENRSLAWVLERLQQESGKVLSHTSDDDADVARAGWMGEVVTMQRALRAARRHYWLRDVPAERPNADAHRRLRAARTAFYAVKVQAVIETLRRYVEEPSADDITDLLSERYFEPARDWQLFEVVVALRLEAAFRAASMRRRKSRLLIGVGRAPYARFELPNGNEIRLWYQAWPPAAHASVHRSTRDRYAIAGGDARPDLMVERVRPSGESDAVVLELKASRSASYLSQGVFQILGYLKDRPELLRQRPVGWLVAPTSAAFTSVDPGEHEIWAVSADHVADAAVSHFLNP